MKAHALLCAIALAAGIGISMAQSNVVTNVSVYLMGGGNFNLICNPLNSTNNDITNLFRFTVQDGDTIYRWNPVIQDIDATAYDFIPPHFGDLKAWHFILQPGEAVFYLGAGVNTTQTFVGEVIQGPYTNPIPFGTIAVLGNGLFNAFGGIIPVAASLTNALAGLTPADGDQVYFWNVNIQDFDVTIPTYSAFSQTWTPSPVLQPGIGFFYLRAGTNQAQWIRNYTVQ
jgi:hypothetical protein